MTSGTLEAGAFILIHVTLPAVLSTVAFVKWRWWRLKQEVTWGANVIIQPWPPAHSQRPTGFVVLWLLLSHFLFCFLSSPSFPRPTTVTHWSLLSKNYSMSAKLNSYTLSSPAMSFLSQFSEQLFQITPIVQSHQHHPSSHPLLTLPSFPLTRSSQWSIISTNLLPLS